MPKGDKLTAKQQRFVEEYLIDLNATQAAIRAGYSEKTSRLTGHRMITNDNVMAAISAARAQLSERTEITQDRVLRELALIGFVDMGDYVKLTEDGNTEFDWSNLPEGATRVISEITQEVVRTVGGDKDDPLGHVIRTKFKLHDKRAALVDIGRHLGMFTDNVRLSGNVGKLDDEPATEDEWARQYGNHLAPTNGSAESTH